MKQILKDLLMCLPVCMVMSGILFIAANYKNISLIWILSPFWEVLGMCVIGIVFAFINILFSAIKDLFKYKKEKGRAIRK